MRSPLVVPSADIAVSAREHDDVAVRIPEPALAVLGVRVHVGLLEDLRLDLTCAEKVIQTRPFQSVGVHPTRRCRASEGGRRPPGEEIGALRTPGGVCGRDVPERSSGAEGSPTPRGMHPRFVALQLCFLLSGFAALLYETAWVREFGQAFGTTQLAAVGVLAAYMGGLAGGAAVAARIVPGLRRPLLAYAWVELGVAAGALVVPWGIRAATGLDRWMAGGQPALPDETGLAGALFHAAVAFGVLLVPTGLLGATLPLLARHAVRREDQVGGRIGALYAANTIGAVAGTLVAGFVLIPTVGLRLTVSIGAATNALAFGTALLLARGADPLPVAATRRQPDRVPGQPWLFAAVAAAGFAAFAYEVLWIRLLSHLLGGSVQAVATMLASFLLGIALGSGVAARLVWSRVGAARGFAYAQLGAGLLSLVAFELVEWLPGLAHRSGVGNAGLQPATAAIAALLLLPATCCLGATFPFGVRLAARDEVGAAASAGRVYAWNTIGAIAGAVATGLWLLPALRLAGSVQLAAGLNLGVALCAAWLARPRLRTTAGVAAVALVCLLVFPPTTPWSLLRHRTGERGAPAWTGEVLHYGVGRSATILLFDEQSGWRLTANGRPEARVDKPDVRPDPYQTSLWLGLLPVLARPDSRSMLVIGLGGGQTIEAVPGTVRSIEVIELEPEVVRAQEVLERRRGRSVLSDPRVRLVVNDARSALRLSDARFDAIVSQPSHPWTAGASQLYTREFFALAADRLTPGGVFVQWITLDLVDEALLRSLAATLLSEFAQVSLFEPVGGVLLFVASDAPFDRETSAARALATAPEDFARFHLRRPRDVTTRWVLDTRGVRRLARDARPNSDDRNRLASRSAGFGPDALGVAGFRRLLAPDG